MFSMGRKSESSEPIYETEPPILTAAPTASSSSAAPPPPPSPPWIELPDDLTANILQRLDAEEILESAEKVCATWWRVCKNPAMWRVIDLDYRRCAAEDEFEIICHRAVDRSQGQLIDLKVTSCEEDYVFLNYVAERSSQLRCLTLAEYDTIGTSMIEAIKKLPQLEELHLIKMPLLNPKHFETIGISCPMLKSFTYNEYWDEPPEFSEDESDLDARFYIECGVAIGKTMPNLRHLRLLAHRMKNEGLEAILDGCPHLESLDLRRCSGLDLEGALGKRCSEQIKDLRLPSDCIRDINWRIKYHYDDDWNDNKSSNWGYYDDDWNDNKSSNWGESNISGFFHDDFYNYDYDSCEDFDGSHYFWT